MPYLPGGAEQQVIALKELLAEIDRVHGHVDARIALNDGKARSVKEAVVQLKSAGLIEQVNRETVRVSEELQQWYTDPSYEALLAILHRNVKFVGECLQCLSETPLQIGEIQEIANGEYDMGWKTRDQARRRIGWFRSMGLAEYKTSKVIRLTSLGAQLKELLQLGRPQYLTDALQSASVMPLRYLETVDAGKMNASSILELVKALDENSLRQRDPKLGYIPQGSAKADVVCAIKMLVGATEGGLPREKYIEFVATEFGISESSFGAALTTVTKMGLVEETGFAEYSPTQLGSNWLEDPTPLNLVLILHTRLRFVLELVPALHEYSKAPSLARVVAERFRLKRIDVEGIRRRLQFLKAAGLIEERSNWRYQPTPYGEQVVNEYPLESIDEPEVSATVEDAEGLIEQVQRGTKLARELTSAGTLADIPTQLEHSVAEAFSYLGFQTKLIGGSGSTDVLATLDTPERGIQRVIIEAKSAGAGNVSEGAISFDTLNDHKRKHSAQFVAVVGPGFERGRIRDRAEQNRVRLLTTSELSDAILRHERTPLSARHFLGLVDPEPSQAEELEDRWKKAEGRIDVLQKVVDVLAAEAQEPDEVTHGTLTSDQIYLMIRNDMNPRPTSTDIQDALSLLEHPFVTAVASERGRYRLTDDPSLIASKFRALVTPLGEIGSN